jgi:hypothetical protein
MFATSKQNAFLASLKLPTSGSFLALTTVTHKETILVVFSRRRITRSIQNGSSCETSTKALRLQKSGNLKTKGKARHGLRTESKKSNETENGVPGAELIGCYRISSDAPIAIPKYNLFCHP